MNIYLVERTDEAVGPGFQWTAFLVAASSDHDARLTHPNGQTAAGWCESGAVGPGYPDDWIPYSDREALRVRLVGPSLYQTDKTVVISQGGPWVALDHVPID
jgi:hypothetical protein